MAKLKMYAALGEYTWLPDLYDSDSLKIGSHDPISLTIADENGMKIIMLGSGFTYKGSRPIDGTVSKVIFEDADGNTLLQYSGGKYDLGKAYKALSASDDIYDLATFLNSGNDVITGTNLGDDIVVGSNAGNDVIKGMGGDDFIKGYAGNNRYDGGTGFDTLSYDQSFYDKAHATKGAIINVEAGTAVNPWGGKDKFSHMEEYRGSHLADKITGSDASFEQFIGFNGKDVFDGGKGEDRVRYDRDYQFGGKHGILADLVEGTIKDGFGKIDTVKNIEDVVGTDKSDTFLGDKNDNWFRGLDGVDSFDGKGGSDVLNFSYDKTDHGIEVDLSLTTSQIIDDGYGNTETALNMEAVSATKFDDIIQLGAATGVAKGDDGDDTLISGTGKQKLYGEGGLDTFVFLTAAGIGSQSGSHDAIMDFTDSNEFIDLNAVFVDGYSFIGTNAFSSVIGEVRYQQVGSNTFVSGDVDGDGDADFALELVGSHVLTEDNFLILV